MICGYQVTKIFALGTTVPAHLLQEALVCLQADIAIWIGKCVRTQCLPEPGSTFACGSMGNS